MKDWQDKNVRSDTYGGLTIDLLQAIGVITLWDGTW